MPAAGNSSQSPLNFPFDTKLNVSNQMGNYSVISLTDGSVTSLFKNARFTPFPTGNPDPKTGFMPRGSLDIHNDDVYDISITSIMDYTVQFDSMSLIPAHFAYLKNLGVYPNNRLMVARRFPGPVGNDLTAIKSFPLATLISWVDNDADFMNISFGEKWVDAKASFEEILGNGSAGDSIGKDLTLPGSDNRKGMASLGTVLVGGAGAVVLPGLMEGLQQKLFVALGLANDTPDNTDIILPVGDPNLIKEGKMRETIPKGKPGSGLKCEFEIKMKVEYEQKFINGVDPTLVYFDLISNVLSFATTDARFMYTQAFATGADNILGGLISGDVSAIQQTISKFIDKFKEVVDTYAKNIADIINNYKTGSPSTKDKITSDAISTVLKNTLGAVIGKYKVAILGVISALTGNASTPWHITIGNPQRPFFSSGDMYMDKVNMIMGPILSFNDLPANITIEFTLRPARNLGAQEIFNRFNTGKGRTYKRNPDFASSNSGKSVLGADNNTTQQNTAFGPRPIHAQIDTQGNILDGNGSTTPFI